MSEPVKALLQAEENHKNVKDETVTIKKTTLWQGLSAVLTILLAISIFTGGFGYGNANVAGNAVVPAQQNAPAPTAPSGDIAPAQVKFSLEGVPVKGDNAAPVTIVEYSDFQCPFCGKFFSETFGQIDDQYIKTGKVKFVYKHFPLDSIHPEATPAALASECAKEQDSFWEYHDTIFQNQQSLSATNYLQWAKDLKLDTAKFSECFESKKHMSRLTADLAEGTANSIRGTPGFLVNGRLISGAQPFEAFKQVIDAELAAAN